MSCSGCRVLRKGCSETCMLRPCLQWIPSPEAQGHATVFVAKFFGRAGLMAFISAVPPSQRPALFQSLLYEACGRSVNPVYGAVGLLWSGNWHICQSAVDRVLQGIPLQPLSVGISATAPNLDHKHATVPSTKRPAPPPSDHQAPTKKHAFSLPSVELHLAPPQNEEEEEEESTPSPSSSPTPSPTPSPTNSQGSITSLDPRDPTMCFLYQEEERKPLDLLH